MGGRGASSGSWKFQLKQYAARGKMPKVIVGTKEAQSKVFKEIDKLYDMPKISPRDRIIDRGDGVSMTLGNSTRRASYPSGRNASQAEKNGVKKWLAHKK